MPSRIHHVGVAVADLDESIRIYESALGAQLVHRATNEKERLEAAFLRVGEGEVELMAALRDDSPVGKFMAKRGPGLHHGAYAVTDIDEALAEARTSGLELIDSEPMALPNSLRTAPSSSSSPSGVEVPWALI